MIICSDSYQWVMWYRDMNIPIYCYDFLRLLLFHWNPFPIFSVFPSAVSDHKLVLSWFQ